MIEGSIIGADRIEVRLERVRAGLTGAMRDAVTRQWYRVQSEVVRGKLSGDPLRRVTGVLASSINVGGGQTATSLTAGDVEIVGRVGTRVGYGAIHEYGGTVTVKAHSRTISQVFGRPVSPHEVMVREHTATFPERSFLRSTLREMRASVIAAIQADVSKAAVAAGG